MQLWFGATLACPTMASRQIIILLLFLFLCELCSPVKLTLVHPGQDKLKNTEDLQNDETKHQMLKVLGLHDLPNARHNIIPHEYMFHIYHKMSTSNYKRKVNTIRGFVDVANVDRFKKFHQMYSFNISALPMSEKLKIAKLRLLRLWSHKPYRYAWAHGVLYRARLYYKNDMKHLWHGRIYTYTQLIPLGSILFDIRNTDGKWMVFNVMKPLRLWQNSTNIVHNFQLQIESVRTGYLMPSYEFGLSEFRRPHHQRALLVSFTDDGRVRAPPKSTRSTQLSMESSSEVKRRVKRRSSRRKRKKLCDRKELYIDFAKLNWSDWIIAPRGYNAYFCQGKCPYPIPAHLNPSNHAMVQNTLNHIEDQIPMKKNRVPPACCIPHKLSGLSMLSVDKGDSIVYKKYDNMVVESCGCK